MLFRDKISPLNILAHQQCFTVSTNLHLQQTTILSEGSMLHTEAELQKLRSKGERERTILHAGK